MIKTNYIDNDSLITDRGTNDDTNIVSHVGNSCPEHLPSAVKRGCSDLLSSNADLISKRTRLDEICNRVEKQLIAASIITAQTAEPNNGKINLSNTRFPQCMYIFLNFSWSCRFVPPTVRF